LTLELEGQTRTIFIHQLRGDRSHSSLPALSPAVELAAYRIASEAINNALTHSEGRRCLVTITANGMLAVTVRDDGRHRPRGHQVLGFGRSWSEPRNWVERLPPGLQATDGRCVHDCRWTGWRHLSETE
jgi:glucose-6-phosphate-specific signal transduction histidine kinase